LATNYKACVALEVPAYVAIYKCASDFLGADILVSNLNKVYAKIEA
jgi:hypothetical protein